MIMLREQKRRGKIWHLFLVLTFVVSLFQMTAVEGKAANNIQYNNKLFTKTLYKNTEKIGFGSDGSSVIKDKKKIKKVYKLLAGMKLKKYTGSEESTEGFVTLVIHKKNGKKMVYTFSGDTITKKEKYQIIGESPVDKIREIFIS